MTTLEQAESSLAPTPGLLDRERIIAKAGFNRWMVPPAALCIHLCIGMAYGLSVFWKPLEGMIGNGGTEACKNMALWEQAFTTTCDWQDPGVVLTFTLGIVLLGVSAALWGGWLERAGPRKAGVVAALCWAGGFVIGAAGVMVHQLWMIWLGVGLIGGVGLGLGYISPVSTLVKWFPDRRGMATGMAIAGFGGGAMIGSPLANLVMSGGDFIKFEPLETFLQQQFGLVHPFHFAGFKDASGPGVWQTFLLLGAVYFVFMMIGAFMYRVPPANWRPEGWTPPAVANAMITRRHVHLDNAHKTLQFWLIWLVLCLNVSAGIGVISMASPMLQEIFAGQLIGQPDTVFKALTSSQLNDVKLVAGGFVGLFSLFNIAGRFFWASLSDYIGRKNTYYTFFLLGIAMYALAPWAAHSGQKAMFAIFFCVIASMYGGGFATVPAYLADVFGTQFVGAIHGRLLTAWSTAGIVGPVIVVYIKQFEKNAGVPDANLYDVTMYVLAGLLVIGFFCNLAVRPLKDKWFMKPEEVTALQAKESATASATPGSFGIGKGGISFGSTLFWLFVSIPLAWGVYRTLLDSWRIF
jgi:MFS family permease